MRLAGGKRCHRFHRNRITGEFIIDCDHFRRQRLQRWVSSLEFAILRQDALCRTINVRGSVVVKGPPTTETVTHEDEGEGGGESRVTTAEQHHCISRMENDGCQYVNVNVNVNVYDDANVNVDVDVYGGECG